MPSLPRRVLLATHAASINGSSQGGICIRQTTWHLQSQSHATCMTPWVRLQAARGHQESHRMADLHVWQRGQFARALLGVSAPLQCSLDRGAASCPAVPWPAGPSRHWLAPGRAERHQHAGRPRLERRSEGSVASASPWRSVSMLLSSDSEVHRY